MADKDQETVTEDAQETVKAEASEEKKEAPKPKTKAKTKTKTTAKTKAKTKTKTKTKTQAKPKTKTKTKAAPKTKTKAAPKTKTKTAPKTKTKAAPKTKTAAAEKPAEEPPAAPPPEPPVEPPTEVRTPDGDDGSKKLLLFGGAAGAFFVLVVLTLVIVLAFNFGVFGGGGGKNIIIGFPDNDLNYDIYLLRPGEDEDDGVEIASNVAAGGASYYALQDGKVVKSIGGIGFVPDSSQVVISYSDDGETILEQMRVRDDETSELFDTDDQVTVGIFTDQDFMLLIEYQDDSVRCYVAPFGEEADRIDRGTDCWPSIDGRYLVVIDEDDGETTFTKYDLKRDDEQELLTVEDVASYKFSDDLSMLAYVINSSSDEQELHIYNIDADEGDDLEEDHLIPDYGFTSKGDLYYIVENDDGEMEAFVHGHDDVIAEGTIMSIQPGPAGEYLIVISGDEEDDLTVYSYSMRREEAEEIVDGENMQAAISEDPEQVFITEWADGDLTVYTSNLDGQDLTSIYDERDVFSYNVYTVPGHQYFYLSVTTDDGENIFAYEAGANEAFLLLEEWDWIQPLNISSDDRYLIFAAAEDPGDDPILFGVRVEEDADVVELDDDVEGIRNAVFSSNDRDVLYTAINGDDPDQISINLVPISGDDRPEELHDEAELFDVEWGALRPFESLYFSILIYGEGF